jgi:hypothetical protein
MIQERKNLPPRVHIGVPDASFDPEPRETQEKTPTLETQKGRAPSNWE